MSYASRICSIFPLWMESKALVKSTNSIVTCRFFACTPSSSPNNSIKHQSYFYTQLNVRTVLFQTIQFSITTQFKCQTVLFNPSIGPYQVILLWARVELGAMAMMGYSAFHNTPTFLEPHHQIFSCHIQDTRWSSLTSLQRCSRCILLPQPTV